MSKEAPLHYVSPEIKTAARARIDKASQKKNLSTREKILHCLAPDLKLTNAQLCAILELGNGPISGVVSHISRGENAVLEREKTEGSHPPSYRYYLKFPLEKALSMRSTSPSKKGASKQMQKKDDNTDSLSTQLQHRKSNLDALIDLDQKNKEATDHRNEAFNLTLAIRVLADRLADEIAQTLKHRLKERVNGLMEDVVRDIEQERQLVVREAKAIYTSDDSSIRLEAPPQKLSKPSVLIVGLLPQQAGAISVEFGEALDLRFSEAANLNKTKTMARAADEVFLFSSKISHAAEDVVRASNLKIHRVHGGLTKLREALRLHIARLAES